VVESLHPKKGEVRALLDMGGIFTEFAIFSGSDLIFSRKIPVAGRDITKAMMSVLVSKKGKVSLSIEEAEKIKRDIGVPAEGNTDMIDEKISSTQFLSMIRTPLEQLANEIERCFDYYREETGGGKIDSLIFSGGGASMKGLPEYLARELGIGIEIGDPMEGVAPKPNAAWEAHPGLFWPAIGAARSFGKGMNLLPMEIKEEAKRTFTRATILAGVTATVLVLAFLYIGMRLQLTNFQKRIDVARLEYSGLGPQLKLAQTQALANSVLAGEPYWEDVFRELSNIIPDNVYLTGISMEERSIRIEGVIAEEGKELLSGFISILNKGIFRNVKLIATKDINDRESEFELKCRFDREAK